MRGPSSKSRRGCLCDVSPRSSRSKTRIGRSTGCEVAGSGARRSYALGPLEAFATPAADTNPPKSGETEFSILLLGVEMLEFDDVESFEGFANARRDQAEFA